MKTFSESETKKIRDEALNKYNYEKEKFALQLMAMSFYKVKSILNSNGMKKVDLFDLNRSNNEKKDQDYNLRIWKLIDDVWHSALGKLIIGIAEIYDLDLDKDIDTNSL